jgi:hypothetical protein
MTIHNSLARGATALVVAGSAAAVLFVLAGFVLPAWMIPVLFRQDWDDLPIGTGLLILPILAVAAILSLVFVVLVTKRLYKNLSPALSDCLQ